MSFVDIPVSHGRLEGLLWAEESPKAAVVVCHPHPMGGGTMHNHVTYRIADAFRKAGVSALRFNFRGVGRSTGTYDEGRGEIDDARAALNFLAEKSPGAPLLIAGFSFGSRIALRIAADDLRVRSVLAVGLALDLFDFGFAREVTKPKAFIQSDRDEYAELDAVRTFVGSLPEPKQLFVVENADHLCQGRLEAFEAAATQAVDWLVSWS